MCHNVQSALSHALVCSLSNVNCTQPLEACDRHPEGADALSSLFLWRAREGGGVTCLGLHCKLWRGMSLFLCTSQILLHDFINVGRLGESSISKNSLILNQFSSPAVCLHQQRSRLSCAAADAIDFLIFL